MSDKSERLVENLTWLHRVASGEHRILIIKYLDNLELWQVSLCKVTCNNPLLMLAIEALVEHLEKRSDLYAYRRDSDNSNK